MSAITRRGINETDFFSLFFAVIILGCSPSFTVDTDWDSGYDFSQWQTFMLKPIGLRQGDAGQAVSQIRRELQRQLREKGYAESKENPDFLVAVHAISRQKKNVNVSSFGYGYGPLLAVPECKCFDLSRRNGNCRFCRST
jgi:hypothetical protein